MYWNYNKKVLIKFLNRLERHKPKYDHVYDDGWYYESVLENPNETVTSKNSNTALIIHCENRGWIKREYNIKVINGSKTITKRKGFLWLKKEEITVPNYEYINVFNLTKEGHLELDRLLNRRH